MTSPITNLRKTNLGPEKIIKYDLESKTHTARGHIPIEAQIYYVRRNSPPDVMDKENIIYNMADRLAMLEHEMTGVKLELSKAIEVINRKDAEITMLKLQLYHQSNQPPHPGIPVVDKRFNRTYEDYDRNIENPDHRYYERPNIDWKKKYHDLLDRVNEMEKFLADYGMIWVGDKKSADIQDGIIESTIEFVPDLDKIISIIRELNERISSENHIKIKGNEARFQKADILNITFYNDGMKLENNHFHKYPTKSALAFFRDLEDGFYPAELKESYPEGVIFKVTDKRSMPYEGQKQEESIFSSPGYRLGSEASSIGKSNQTNVYFQFDMSVKKKAFPNANHKKISCKKLFPVTAKQDLVPLHESWHEGLHNISKNISIKERGAEEHIDNRSFRKKILKKNKESKYKSTKSKRGLKKVVFEKSATKLKNTRDGYFVSAESQSAPALHHNVREHYYAPEHPQQSKSYPQYRENENRKKRKEMYEKERYRDTTSSGSSDDSIVTNTVYGSSYNPAKKKIYDATSELAKNRPKLADKKDIFDTDEEFEHMVILGKKGKIWNGNRDDPNAVESTIEGKGLKSKAQRDTEYDEYSSNIENIRASIGSRRSSARASIDDRQSLKNSFNDDMTKEGQFKNNRKMKSKAAADSESYDDDKAVESRPERNGLKSKGKNDTEYDEYSSNIKNIRSSMERRASAKSEIDNDPQSLQNRLNDDMTKEGQFKNNRKMKSKAATDSESFDDDKSVESRAERKGLKSKRKNDTEYDEYSSNIKNIRSSMERRGSAKSDIDNDPQSIQNRLNDGTIEVGQPKRSREMKSKAATDSEISDDNNGVEYHSETKGLKSKAQMGRENNQHNSNTKNNKKKERRGSSTASIDESQSLQNRFNDDMTKEGQLKNNRKMKSKAATDSESYDDDKAVESRPERNGLKSKGKNDTEYDEYSSNIKNIRSSMVRRSSAKPDINNDPQSLQDTLNVNMAQEGQLNSETSRINDRKISFSEGQSTRENEMHSTGKSTNGSGKSNVIPNSEIEKEESEDSISMSTEYDDSYGHGNAKMNASGKNHFSTHKRNSDPNEEMSFSGNKAKKQNILPLHKRSSVDESEGDDSRSNSLMTTEYNDAYESGNESYLSGNENRHKGDSIHIKKPGSGKPGERVIINSNQESENFVLGNEVRKSPLTSEYRDAFGAKGRYVVQCSTNFHRDKMLNNNDRSIELHCQNPFSKEPRIIPLNNKTSDGQIELNMKSFSGNEIYSAYLYPDDPISKVWPLTELNCKDFVVTADHKVLHLDVPLKNYNINGDITLKISKRKSSSALKEVYNYESKNHNEGGDAYYSSDEDYFSKKVGNDEGYSS